MMTRREHLDWAIDRAIKEMDYYKEPSKGIVSMMSDLRKHPETNSDALASLCAMMLLKGSKLTRQEVIEFLKGFN